MCSSLLGATVDVELLVLARIHPRATHGSHFPAGLQMPCKLESASNRSAAGLPLRESLDQSPLYGSCHGRREEARRMRSVGHGTPTALRPSLPAALYSSSVATQIITSPVWAVQGSVSALKPSRHEPSSARRSTCCPGSGMRGGLFKRGIPRRAEPPT